MSDYPGIWMTHSGSIAYRVVPKAACSTIGQMLHFTDHGRYFDGDIHDDTDGLHKWGQEGSRPVIIRAVEHGEVPIFTSVRNPYTRILSAFFDKICGLQRNGKRYRGNLVPSVMQGYGVEIEGDFDQIDSFRRFLLFARDTIRFRKPMDPDIHWSAQAGHISTLVAKGGRLGHVVATERLSNDMAKVFDGIPLPHPIDLADVPRFNESAGHGPKRAHPVSAYFDDLARHLIWDIYRQDFELFGYDPDDPDHGPPKQEVDLEKLHRVLSG